MLLPFKNIGCNFWLYSNRNHKSCLKLFVLKLDLIKLIIVKTTVAGFNIDNMISTISGNVVDIKVIKFVSFRVKYKRIN